MKDRDRHRMSLAPERTTSEPPRSSATDARKRLVEGNVDHIPGRVPSGRVPSRFLGELIERLEALEALEGGNLDRAAELIWQALCGDRLVHVAGTGHSALFALEAFYRAGGLAAVSPIWHPALLPLAGARLSTLAERVSGLGPELVRSARVTEGDVVVVFSNSGVNPVPVEVGEAARALGASVIAVLSLDHCLSVPSRHPTGLRLPDVADVAIDTGAPIGDASYRPRPGAPAVAPLSTLLGAYAWNALLVRLADRAAAAGVELPVWTSANLPEGNRQSAGHFARFENRIRAL